MTEEAKQAKRAYMKAWRDSHKENIKKHQETYWNKKADKEKEQAEKTEG